MWKLQIFYFSLKLCFIGPVRYQLLLLFFRNFYYLPFPIDASDKFESYLILKIDCEMSEEKDALFYYFDIGFESEGISDLWAYQLEKLSLLLGIKWSLFGYLFMVDYLIFEFLAEPSADLILICEFIDCRDVIIEGLIFFTQLT